MRKGLMPFEFERYKIQTNEDRKELKEKLSNNKFETNAQKEDMIQMLIGSIDTNYLESRFIYKINSNQAFEFNERDSFINVNSYNGSIHNKFALEIGYDIEMDKRVIIDLKRK